jgi:outer membrane protein TolC
MSRRFLPLMLSAPFLFLSPLALRAQDAPKDAAPPAEPQELKLSMEEAVKRALENNVDISVQRFVPQFAYEAIRGATGIYDPLASAQLNGNYSTTPETSVFSGGPEVSQHLFNYNFGVSEYLPTGGTLSLLFSNNRTSTNNVYVLFNPSFGSSLTLNLTQPLLKNWASDFNREQLALAKKNKEISDAQFEQTIVTTIAGVRGLYFDYLTALDTLDAAKKSLALAQQLVNENKIKVRVGTLAPLDVISAESEVASREEAVIQDEASITDAEDNLKAAIFPKDDPTTWAVHIIPTDTSTPTIAHVDVDRALATAMDKRTDLVAMRREVELMQIGVDFSRSQSMPQLDLVGAIGTQGVGGTEIVRSSAGGPITEVIPGGYGDALSQVFSSQFPTWKIGLNFSYPIGNRSASAALAQARINKDQAIAILRRLEIQVATEVRSAARAVETNIKRIDAARAARVLEEQTLDAEEKKFAAGMSTNYLVTQVQRDLANAVVTEIQTVNDYNKSVVNFDRTQIAGPGSLSTLAFSTALSGASAAGSPAGAATTTTGAGAPSTTAGTTTTVAGTSPVPTNPAVTVIQGKPSTTPPDHN